MNQNEQAKNILMNMQPLPLEGLDKQSEQPKTILIDMQTLTNHLEGLNKQNQAMRQMLKSALDQAGQVKQLELKFQGVEEQLQSTNPTGLHDQAHQLMGTLIATLNETAERLQSFEVQQQKLTSEVSNSEIQTQSFTQLPEQAPAQAEALLTSSKTSIFSVKVLLNNKPVGLKTIFGVLLTVGIVQAAVGLPLAALVLGGQKQLTLGQIKNLEHQASSPLKQVQ